MATTRRKPVTPAIRDRIIGFERLPVRLLTPHPLNWRRHPTRQANALRAALAHIGMAAALIVRPLGEGYQILDGHLRADLKLDLALPCLLVDLDDTEAEFFLTTFDPLSTLIEADAAYLDTLLTRLHTDDEDLGTLLDDLRRQTAALTPAGVGGPREAEQEAARLSLAERFLIPPFSVLDARQGYWQERKRAWLALGIQSELGRGEGMPSGEHSGSSEWSGHRGPHKTSPGGSPRPAATLGPDGKTQRGNGKGQPMAVHARSSGQELMRGEHAKFGPRTQLNHPTADSSNPTSIQNIPGFYWKKDRGLSDEQILADYLANGGGANISGTSIFDPVLCELAYRWFCPPEGSILDPFAGGSVRGIVAALLGRQYTGIDLRPEQLAANEAQAQAICPEAPPRWIAGDSRDLRALKRERFDLLFTCPPYFDLEQYSADPRDLSNADDYAAFLEAYRLILAQGVARLKDDRFACLVVGDLRDGQGLYRNFVSDTITAMHDAGARLYNDAVLVTAVGSLPIRVGKQFTGSRKLGKTHQNVLVWIKGDPARATAACGPVEVADPAEQFGELANAATA